MLEHPVTAYARAVVAGDVVAGRLVRLACERHLRDLVELTARGYRFSEKHADHVLNFFPEYLRFYDAGEKTDEPFVLAPAWTFIVGMLYGWLGPDGYRRFRTGYIEMGKGNAKTMVLAGLMLYALTCDDEPGAQIVAAAVTREQARELFDAARHMAGASPALAERLGAANIGKQQIYDPATRSFIRPVSSEGRSLDAKRVHFAAIDEIHEHRTDVVVTKLGLGIKGRRQPLVLEITNSGYDRTSVCWRHHDLSRRILEGAERNETWFAYVCGLDPCEACRTKGHEMPQEGCENCDDWRDERVWPKTNPLLDVAVPRSYLRGAVQQATQMPTMRNYVRRLNFCTWTESAEHWFTADAWALGHQAVEAAALRGRPCVAGLDLAQSEDLAALILIFPDEEFFVEPSPPMPTVEETASPRMTLQGGVDILAYFWCPEEAILARSRNDRVPYDTWRDQGFIEPTPGRSIDYRYIRRRITELRAAGVNIREICYDPAYALQFALQLQDEDGFSVVPVHQGFPSLNEPSFLLEQLVARGALRHGGHPILAWHAANAVKETDSLGRRRPAKGKATERMDGVAALVTGLRRVIVARPPAGGSMESQTIAGPARATAGIAW